MSARRACVFLGVGGEAVSIQGRAAEQPRWPQPEAHEGAPHCTPGPGGSEPEGLLPPAPRTTAQGLLAGAANPHQACRAHTRSPVRRGPVAVVELLAVRGAGSGLSQTGFKSQPCHPQLGNLKQMTHPSWALGPSSATGDGLSVPLKGFDEGPQECSRKNVAQAWALGLCLGPRPPPWRPPQLFREMGSVLGTSETRLVRYRPERETTARHEVNKEAAVRGGRDRNSSTSAQSPPQTRRLHISGRRRI